MCDYIASYLFLHIFSVLVYFSLSYFEILMVYAICPPHTQMPEKSWSALFNGIVLIGATQVGPT